MGQSRLEIAISAMNEASGQLKEVQEQLKAATAAQKTHNEETNKGSEASGGYAEKLNEVVSDLTGFNLATLAGVGAVGAIGTALIEATQKTIEYDDAIEQVSIQSGQTSEEASKLVQLFERFGMSAGTLETVMRGMAQRGIALTTENLIQLSRQFNALPDQTSRNTFALQTFGRTGLEVEEMLKRGPDVLRGYIDATNEQLQVTEKQLDQNEQLKMDLADLHQNWDALSIVLGQQFIPVADAVVKGFLNANKVTEENAARMRDLVPVVIDGKTAWLGANGAIIQMTASEKSHVEEEGFLKNAIEGTNTAIENNKQKTLDAKEAQKALKEEQAKARDEMKLVTDSFSKLTEQMLYNEAAAGLDAKSALALAQHMGLVDQYTYSALKTLSDAKDAFAAANTPMSEQEKILEGIVDQWGYLLKAPAIINFTVKVNQEGTMDYSQATGTGKVVTSTRGTKGYVSPDIKGPGRAIGGPFSGPTIVGENGPEVVTGSGYVVNNYDYRSVNYSLAAHYPTYQDPHAARNDLIALTMLKNRGASQWAA